MTLRVIDLFSGIGGFALAADRLGGFTTVQFVEREPFCQQILRKHWPDVPIHDDVCTYAPPCGSADVVIGGFPCQDISAAGKQAGIKEGTRSGLFYELMRIVRAVGPQFVVLENVAAITSNGLGTVLGELAEAGYDAEWACIPASAVGACHQRDRWWCVAYASHMLSHGGAGEQPGQSKGRAIPQPRDGDGKDAADTRSLRGQRRRAPINVAGKAGTCEADGQEWQRDGNAADDCSANAAHSDNQGPQGLRQQLELPESSRQETPSWSCQPRMPEPDWRRFISEPVLRRGDDGLSGRAHRLRALGNAVVPQVAMIPLARVLALASEEAQ